MRHLCKTLLASGALAVIGGSGTALAQAPQAHVMTVRLPGGGVAEIRYTGNVAPRITFSDAPAPIDVTAPLPALFGFRSPFAMLDRISAAMDRQTAAMFRQTDRLMTEALPGQLTSTALGDLPRGVQSFTFASTISGNGVCSQSVEITSTGGGAPPRVERHSAGNCTALRGGAGSVELPAAPPGMRHGPLRTTAPPSRPDVVWTSAAGSKPYGGLVRQIPPAPR